MDNLTLKQQAFVNAYLSGDTKGNGWRSAKKAGYKGNEKTLIQVASENLLKPCIRRAINEVTKHAERKATRELVDVYAEFEEQLIFAKQLRSKAQELLNSTDPNDRKFAIDAVKVCDLTIDKFAKLGGEYTADRQNPADIGIVADAVARYKAQLIDDDDTWHNGCAPHTKGQPMPTEAEMRVEIERLCRHSKVDPSKLDAHIQQQELGRVD